MVANSPEPAMPGTGWIPAFACQPVTPAACAGTELSLYVEQANQLKTALSMASLEIPEEERERRDRAWLREHRAKYAGSWVALAGGRLLAIGKSAKEVYAKLPSQDTVPLVMEITEDFTYAGC